MIKFLATLGGIVAAPILLILMAVGAIILAWGIVCALEYALFGGAKDYLLDKMKRWS